MNMVKKKDAGIDSMVRKVAKDKRLLSEVLVGITSEKPQVKYKSGMILMILSEEHPEILYPKWDHFVALLGSENTFMKSIGIKILSNLTRVDAKNKFDKIFDRFYGLLNDESMITAANVVDHSGMIARSKPKLQGRITNKLLGIDKTHHGPECKNIIKGKAILSFGEYFEEAGNKKKMIEFARKELKNTRPATRKKAEKFLKNVKYDRK
jgi:hypothetical protein